MNSLLEIRLADIRDDLLGVLNLDLRCDAQRELARRDLEAIREELETLASIHEERDLI